MAQDTTQAASVIPAGLEAFTALLTGREHALARGGDESLAQGAINVAKDICDLGTSPPLPRLC